MSVVDEKINNFSKDKNRELTHKAEVDAQPPNFVTSRYKLCEPSTYLAPVYKQIHNLFDPVLFSNVILSLLKNRFMEPCI